MQNFLEYKVENNNILSSIDKSIKKAREMEAGKYPYAVIISSKNSGKFNLENLTYLPKDGFKSIPIVKHPTVAPNSIKLAYNEESLIQILENIH